MRGGGYANVGANRPAAAHSIKFAFLQNSEQRHLNVGSEFADFVQEDGTAFSQLKAAQTALQGPGESSFFMTE